ncbi:Glutathione transport system permease protein GsiD [Vibrio aerogenes CECT 7868]|uniref:Glutathione transport system permease protein GsiD n=1 Tax=Vibrio aerogenes CECT 7868 TaxID=1216006 RepID=A0A1M6D5B8_9VIBR|nr:ABC transporter permease [Vibrio aerogenes]SHI68311.1 Glutathione transport system permease protein GsiD [Vibrio aerogenes CECT 7868]
MTVPSSQFSPLWQALKKISSLICLLCLFLAVFGPSLAPYNVGEVVSKNIFAPVSEQFLLGTDYLGRDNLSRILNAIRYTVGLSLTASVLASCTGTLIALTAVMSPKWLEEIIIRLVDALISIPSKMLALVIVAGFGSSIHLLIITAVIGYAPGAFRIAYSLALSQHELEYVQAAKIRGESPVYIAVREILPNILNPVLADFGLRFVFIVLLLSGLSFLGLGIQPPNADLGSLVRENIGGLSQGAVALIAPAITIGMMTVAVNLVIDRIAEQRNQH